MALLSDFGWRIPDGGFRQAEFDIRHSTFDIPCRAGVFAA